MNTRKYFRKFRILSIALVASSVFLSCGSFSGASYFSNDGIYISEISKRSDLNSESIVNNSNYYSNYFKDLVQDDFPENKIYFTDTDNYTSEEFYLDENKDIKSSQIPWGEKSTQTEINIFNTSPNYFWGLSGFAFRGSPFWNNYYFNDPYRFGYGFNGTPFMDPFMGPFMNPYYGGYSGLWRFSPFYSSFGFYGGYGFGYGLNSWNIGYPFGVGYYNYYKRSNGYDKDYISTIARVRSGRGEKNYERTKRSDRIEKQNSKNWKSSETVELTNRVNSGRSLNSLRAEYLLANREKNILGKKETKSSPTARPIIGPTLGVTGSSLGNTNPSKGMTGNSKRRFSEQPYRSFRDRQSPKTTSPRSTNQTSRPTRRSISQQQQAREINSSREYNSRSSDNFRKSINRSYNSNNNFYSKPSYRNSYPPPSYNSVGRSSSGNRRH